MNNMSNKKYDNAKQNLIGKVGEEKVIELLGKIPSVTRIDDVSGISAYQLEDVDLLVYCDVDGKQKLRKIEIKTDEMAARTGNFFVEKSIHYLKDIHDEECHVMDRGQIDKVCGWLTGAGEVIFSSEPDKVYRAFIKNSIPFNNVLRNINDFLVQFDCFPFKYSVNWQDEALTLTKATTVFNKGSFASEPIMTVYGTGKLKTFSAYVYGTDENSNPSANDGYIYPSRNFTLPSNIRIVGMYKLLASGGSGHSTVVTLKIGNTTRSIYVRDKNGDYSVFNIKGALTDIQPGASGEVTTIEEAMFAAIYLDSGHRIGTSDAERELTLKMKITDGNKGYRTNYIFYYIEE